MDTGGSGWPVTRVVARSPAARDGGYTPWPGCGGNRWRGDGGVPTGCAVTGDRGSVVSVPPVPVVPHGVPAFGQLTRRGGLGTMGG